MTLALLLQNILDCVEEFLAGKAHARMPFWVKLYCDSAYMAMIQVRVKTCGKNASRNAHLENGYKTGGINRGAAMT